MGAEQNYSISRLSELLGKDRRTLKKYLRDLPAAEERDAGNGRVEKRWKLEDAVAHLTRAQAQPAIDDDDFEGAHEIFKAAVAEELFPILTNHQQYFGGLTGYAHAELSMSKTQALDFAGHVTLLLMSALSEIFRDQEMQFAIGERLVEWNTARSGARSKQYLAKHWPERPARNAARPSGNGKQSTRGDG